MNCVIFIKAPAPGHVKTRLVSLLGDQGAAHLSELLARETFGIVHASKLKPVVAYQPAPGFATPNWLHSRQIVWFSQRGRDLGRRLIHAARRAGGKGAVLIVGSDLPDLSVEILHQAAAALRQADVVLGPTHDGGYYLVGLRQFHPGIFRDIPWSSPKTLRVTLARAKNLGLRVHLLPKKRDIDTPADYRWWWRTKDRRGIMARHENSAASSLSADLLL